MSPLTFNGKIALVTGAGSGIGRAISVALATNGARVVVGDVNHAGAEETLKLIKESGDHFAVPIDVSKEDSAAEAFRQIGERYGQPPSLLAQAAGITRDNFLHKLNLKQFSDVVDINLKGTFIVQQQFVKSLFEREDTEGSIVNISSIVAKHGNMGQSNYSASKAGVEAFTKTTAKELGKKGIRVNCVSPGFINTPMLATVPENLKEMVLFMTSLKRMGKPEEVAEAVSFLLSDKSSYITGAVLEVTGGLSI